MISSGIGKMGVDLDWYPEYPYTLDPTVELG